MQGIDHFLSIAEIAGVFIGFGSLISFSQDQSREARTSLRMIVGIGLLVLVTALLPVWLTHFDLSDRALWGWSSGVFLVLIWTLIAVSFMNPEHRAWQVADLKANPLTNIIFWLCLEVPIQVPLVLAMLGIAPRLAPAFYLTALILNLFEAAFVFARMVFARNSRSA